jgi:hypothetical protein
MKCPRCHQDNPSRAKFCLECRTPADGMVSSHADLKAQLEGLRSSLGKALDQQTATAEILRVISSSPTDLQPVFEAIVQSAVQLCEAVNGGVFRFDGALIHLVAQHGWDQALDAVRRAWPRPPDRGTTTGRAILTRAVVHVDVAQGPEYEQRALIQSGFRIGLSVPGLRSPLRTTSACAPSSPTATSAWASSTAESRTARSPRST